MARDSVEYVGIAEKIRSSKYFRQIVVDGKFCLPDDKPAIEQVTDVEMRAEVNRAELIGTPTGTSAEGTRLSGWSIVVQGQLIGRMQYIGALPKQPVITAMFAMPFLTTLVVDPCTLPYEVDAVAHIEDISVTAVDACCIYARVALYIAARGCDRRCPC